MRDKVALTWKSIRVATNIAIKTGSGNWRPKNHTPLYKQSSCT